MREVFDLNRDWLFHRGEIEFRNHGGIHAERYAAAEWMKAGNHGVARPEYPDQSWDPVNLPHDFLIDGGFTPEANLTHGSLPTDVGWYRKTFTLPAEDVDKCLRLEFDGVYRDCQVWLNGHFVGRHLSGYTSFAFDITEICEFGKANTLAVRADAREYELWSYEGGGIYRDVRLVKTAPVHIEPNGVWAKVGHFDGSDPEAVEVEVETALANAGTSPASIEIQHRILAPDGALVAEAHTGEFQAQPYCSNPSLVRVSLSNPTLWSLENPNLYQIETSVVSSGRVVDQVTTTFGVRSVKFSAKKGFFLNGRPVKLKGVCNHQDHAGVGIAIPEALDAWRVERVKAMGANAIRTAHNPAGPDLLDACDRLGVLVLDEQRQMGGSAEHLGQLEDLIKRDRNHPCIFAWSLGNEEMVAQHTDLGVRQFRKMQDLAHYLDPTRPVTYAMNCDWLGNSHVHNDLGFRFDVYGANYVCRAHCDVTGELYDQFHERYPDWPLLGTETGGSASTRGVYVKEDAEPGLEFNETAWWTNPKRKGVISAYGETCTPWGYSVEQTWKDCYDRDFLSGTFLWTGFDYRGETYPAMWPAVVTCYGLMDLCGFPKDAFHYYRVWWNDEPAIHLFPHWNWPGKEGEIIEVWCYSNAHEVELRLNDRSLGRRAMPPRGHLAWEVPYEAGRLTAVAYDQEGGVAIEDTVETSEAISRVKLSADRTALKGNGRDLVPVEVKAVDRDGKYVPVADDLVSFEATGPVRILGVGNGNPCSHESDREPERHLFKGLCQVLLQSTIGSGNATLRASIHGQEPSVLEIDVVEDLHTPAIESIRLESPVAAGESDNSVDNAL